ncbi:MAG TPA: TIGR03118 family protein [Granulicella sp.]|nr:TIGR03118 family protein [Granulicella sp.]
MKTQLRLTAGTALALSLMGAVAFGQHYNQTNLVSNTTGVAAATDASLINPWGMARSSGSPWWVADNGTGLSTLYSGAGAKQALVVTIPAAVSGSQGTPTGAIFNGSPTDFLLAPGKQAIFLFATMDGTIAGWNPGVAATHAVTVVKTTDGSVYTGLTSAFVHDKLYLYAANFGKGRVDVYDNAFHQVQFGKERSEWLDEKRFDDDRLPPHYVPFNVQAIGDDIVVTYALHEAGSPVETDGPGLGYVDIYTSDGRLLRRLEHGDWLNAPWGVALAPLDFGRFSHHLLIAQFAGGGTTESSGWIAAYDLTTGRFDGLLEDASGKPVAINGIWAISPGNASPGNDDAASAPAAELYFTAGPVHSTGGLFGYLTAVSTELIKGNDQ